MNAKWLIDQQQSINEQGRTGTDERIRTKMVESALGRMVKKNTGKTNLAMCNQE